MVTQWDTHFQRGYLMGMEAIVKGDNIMAPPWYRDPENAQALEEFNLGVSAAYTVWRASRG